MTERRQPHTYVCPHCGGHSELVTRTTFGAPEIVVHHLAGCKYEGAS